MCDAWVTGVEWKKGGGGRQMHSGVHMCLPSCKTCPSFNSLLLQVGMLTRSTRINGSAMLECWTMCSYPVVHPWCELLLLEWSRSSHSLLLSLCLCSPSISQWSCLCVASRSCSDLSKSSCNLQQQCRCRAPVVLWSTFVISLPGGGVQFHLGTLEYAIWNPRGGGVELTPGRWVMVI